MWFAVVVDPGCQRTRHDVIVAPRSQCLTGNYGKVHTNLPWQHRSRTESRCYTSMSSTPEPAGGGRSYPQLTRYAEIILNPRPVSRPPRPNPLRAPWLLIVTAVLFGSIGVAHAHKLGQSYLFLQLDGERVGGRLEITTADLNLALDLGLPTDGSATGDNLAAHTAAIHAYYRERVAFALEGRTATLEFGPIRFLPTTEAQYVVLEFALPNQPRPPAAIDVRYEVLFDEQPQHRGLLVIERNWQTGTFDNETNIALVFAPNATTQTLDLSQGSTWRGFVAMVSLGTHHIWIGIDHILFLVALLLPGVLQRSSSHWRALPSARPALIYLIKIVTLFTVAHTITLSYATLGTVELSSRFVESVIAASIAIAAFDLLVPIFHGRIGWVVFVFGLFHGFGFASVLSEIGIPAGYLVHSLLGFNLGVELGQLAIVAAVFPVIYLIRASDLYLKVVVPGGAVVLIVIAVYWFVERAFEINLPAGALLQRLLVLFG